MGRPGDNVHMDEQPTRTRRVLTSYPVRLLLVAVVVCGGIAVINRTGQPSGRTPATPTSPVFTSAAPTVPGQIQPGVWIVGADVQPGTYRSTGAGDGGYCMWSRHSTTGGGPMDAIIASDGALSPGGVLVTIEATDKVFRTRGCAPFQRIG